MKTSFEKQVLSREDRLLLIECLDNIKKLEITGEQKDLVEEMYQYYSNESDFRMASDLSKEIYLENTEVEK